MSEKHIFIEFFIFIKLQGAATKKSDAYSLIYLHYLQHYKGTTNVFGATLGLVNQLVKMHQIFGCCTLQVYGTKNQPLYRNYTFYFQTDILCSY